MKPTIPLFKVLTAPEASWAVSDVLSSGYVGQGKKVDEFERKLKAVLHSDRLPITVNSCTSAIDLSLRLIGIRPGDYVITTPMTCTATNSPIVTQGAIPVWADVDSNTGCIDPRSVADILACGFKPKAIVAVDWSGLPCDYEALGWFGIPIIEDAAHAFRARYLDAPIARLGGNYICWSFQAIKALNTGDGGCLLAPEYDTDRARLLRWYGLDRTLGESFRCAQDIEEVGFKYHMNDIAAAIGLANLQQACIGVYKNQDNARFYSSALRGLNGVVVPRFTTDCSFWLYTILVENRPEFERFMAGRGIVCSQVHARNDQHTGFKKVSLSPVYLGGLDSFCELQIAIPVGWWLSQQDREYIAESVIAWSKTL